MKLKDLKQSILCQSSDLDDMEVMLCVSRKGERQYEPVAFFGYAPLEDKSFVVFGGLTEIQRMVESGDLPKPDGYIEPSVTDKLITGEDNQ